MPKIEEKIVITSAADLQHHFDSILPSLQLAETEDSWQKIEKSLIKLEAITKSGGYKHDSFTTLFKSVAQPVINSLLSERTKLSGTAADLLNSVAPRLGERFESLIHVFAPTLLLICARTNKVALVRAKKCLLLIAKHCKLPSLLTHLRDASKDKSQTMRMVSVEVTLMLLEAVDSKEKIGRRVADIETLVKGTATDRDPEVRQWCKRVFEVYIDWWPERVTLFTSSFTPTTRRYLALPKTSLTAPAKPVAVQKAHVTPSFKRSDPSQSHHTSTAAIPSLPIHKASHTTSKQHSSTSHVASTSQAQRSNKARPAAKEHSSAPSSTASSSRSTQPVISVTEAKQSAPKPAVESEDDRRRAELRAEILKQATGTPSQSIAARLALQQLDFQLFKSQKASAATEGEQHEVVQRQTDRALFNIAMAKKKQSPQKMPSRIIVVAAPSTTSQKALGSTSKPAQRIVSASSSSGKAKKAEEDEEPDVFRSRPISTKMTSSLSKGLSAREKLLKTSSSLKATSSPLANRGIKGARSTPRKKTALKVDIGKENIPPNSELASIAQSAQMEVPEAPRGRIAPSVLIAGTVATVEVSRISRPAVSDEQASEVEEVLEVPAHEEEKSVEAVESDIILEMPSDVKNENTPVVETEAVTAAPSSNMDETAIIEHDDKSTPIPASSEKDSPLNDWNEVATSLPSEKLCKEEEEEEQSTPLISPDNDNLSSPPQRVVIAPFMSTPARKTLGEIHQNIVSPLSLSSPLLGKAQLRSKSIAAKTTIAPASILSLKSPVHTAQDGKSHASKSKRLILAISRKM